MNQFQVIGSSIYSLCKSLPITKVIAITLSDMPRVISTQMIKQPIIAISNNKHNAKSFNLYRGTQGFLVKYKLKKIV